MEITIVKDVQNPLLERREIEAIVSFQGATPSRKEILAELSKKLKVDDTHIEVDKIYQRFGKQEAKVIAFVFPKPIREKEETKQEQEGGTEEAKASEQTQQ